MHDGYIYISFPSPVRGQAAGWWGEAQARALEERQGVSQGEALTQERQSDCQATCRHGNGKWRARGEETEEEREKARAMLQVKTTLPS